MDGYTVTCTHEFGQIRVQSMVGKPRHLLDVRVILLRLHNRQSQDVADGNCILIVGLIKISFVKDYYSIVAGAGLDLFRVFSFELGYRVVMNRLSVVENSGHWFLATSLMF